MEAKQSTRSQKVLKWLLASGLLLALGVLIMRAMTRAGSVKLRMTQPNQQVIVRSKYNRLLPYIVAMAQHETGNFTSNVYNKNNNMFGMLMPRRRPTIATRGTASVESPGEYWAAFTNDTDSIEDLFLWMDYTRFPVSVAGVDEFALALKSRSYFGDTIDNYTNALKRWIERGVTG